jgi:hypothetical protein
VARHYGSHNFVVNFSACSAGIQSFSKKKELVAPKKPKIPDRSDWGEVSGFELPAFQGPGCCLFLLNGRCSSTGSSGGNYSSAGEVIESNDNF